MTLPNSFTIGGEPAGSAQLAPVINPATGRPCAEVPMAGPAEVDQAVRSAARAFKVWGHRPADERRTIVTAYLDVVQEHLDELAELVTLEQGKPLDKARSEVQAGLAFARAYAAIELPVQVLRDSPQQRAELHRRPLGVVGAITAWNYPALLALWKIAPALLTGNTVVLKPAPGTPLAALRLGELGRSVLPPGVLNVVAGDNAAGERLTSHPEVRKIAFTGSSATGRRIMAAAAPTVKRLTLELGGNDAGIVLPDADPQAIAADLFWARFSNAGQVCAGLKRLFVPASLHGAVVDALSAVARTVVVGEGHAPGVQMGPVQNRAQFDRLHRSRDQALARGATLLFEAELPQALRDSGGYFFPMTLLGNVDEHMDVVAEESFGPILGIQTYADIDAAIQRANATEYGLGGSVWGRDVARASAVAARLECGSAWVNQHPAMGPDIPFGGVKGSGLGVEFGRLGLEEYTAVQVLNIKRG